MWYAALPAEYCCSCALQHELSDALQVPNSTVGQYLNLVCESPAEVTNYRMNKLELTLSGAPYTYSNRSYAAHNKNNVYRPIGWNDTTKVPACWVTESAKL